MATRIPTPRIIKDRQYFVIRVGRDAYAGDLEPGLHWVQAPLKYDGEAVRGVDVQCDCALRALLEWEAEDLGLPAL